MKTYPRGFDLGQNKVINMALSPDTPRRWPPTKLISIPPVGTRIKNALKSLIQQDRTEASGDCIAICTSIYNNSCQMSLIIRTQSDLS